jgi:hypothetical protein
VRGRKVLIDADLAALYGVRNQSTQPSRETQRRALPARLHVPTLAEGTPELEITSRDFQSGVKMGLRRAPFAFTEHGALMAATVLNSPRAVETGLYVVRAFVRLRQFLASHKDLARRLEEHEKRLASHDQAIAGLVNTIQSLMAPPERTQRRPIGFVTPEEKKGG